MKKAQSLPRSEVVEIAKSWIGTPYHHQASVKGVGCDCLGLVRGVWRELYGEEPESPPPYSPDWGQVGRTETLLEAAARHFKPVPLDNVEPGDVLLFRMKPKAIAKHCGIISQNDRLIHAQERVGVCEIKLSDSWKRLTVAGFLFRRNF
ncbi:NlpC/P60 family protein [Roseibium polysiphoniae]|uniref:NlpC/P60 family protein n=1 Tax=Roseibium polysiphoniae TaxID=2571221 RepID=UPI0030B8B1EC